MNIILIILILVVISLHHVNIPLVLKTARSLITPIMLTRLLAIYFLYYATSILYPLYLQNIQPIFELGISNNLSHLSNFFYFSLLEASVCLAITVYCLKYKTKRTNRITLLLYYLMGKSRLKDSFLPKNIIYKQMSLFIVFLLLLHYLYLVFFIKDVWLICLEEFNSISHIKKIKFILGLFTFLVVIWLCYMSDREEKLRELDNTTSDQLKDTQYLHAGPKAMPSLLQLAAAVSSIAGLIEMGYQKTIGEAKRAEETKKAVDEGIKKAVLLAKKSAEEEKAADHEKVKMVAEVGRFSEEVDQAGTILTKLVNLTDMIKKEKEKSEDHELTETIRNQHLTRMQHLEGDLARAKHNLEEKIHKVSDFNKRFKEVFNSDNKTHLINIDLPSFPDLLKTLNFEQVFAVTFFLLSNIILTNVISIIFILFGDYLIIKYKLEEKYPKLAKWIQLRRRLQRYYLMLNIGWILLSVLMIMGTTITIFIMFS